MASAVDIPWPTSSNPGSAPGEGNGRVVNCYAYKDGNGARWKPLPGLTPFATLPAGAARGALVVGSLLYLVIGSSVVQVFRDGSTTILEGSVAGSPNPVTMARNNAVLPDVQISTGAGDYVIRGLAVRTYPDGNLPPTNSVSILDGFFLSTTASGNIWASGLNGTSIDPESFAAAEARPDGLLRGVVFGEQFFAFGSETIEVWQDVGAQPFPLARSTVIECGLIGQWAIAGFEPGWSGPLIFGANDGSVRRLDGYTATRISNVDIERLIARVTDKSTLRASVYTFRGNAMWSLSSPDWTWEHNVTTGEWSERESVGLGRWRADLTVNAFGRWLAVDRGGGALLVITEDALGEADDALIWGLDSGSVKQFPARIQVPGAAFDFVLGQAPQGTDPKVMLSWSHDGGARWSNPVTRSIGTQGKSVGRVTVNRCGLTSHHGMQWRFRVSEPVYTSFAGGRMDAVQR